MKDELGRRIKRDYENAFRISLPRRAYLVVRVDGRAFHTFAADLERPYDRKLARALDAAAVSLCQEMTGCRFAFGQSDEFSFLLTDFESANAPLWFDGDLQKIVSVSASVFTAFFNQSFGGSRPASFDSRTMVIARPEEVADYFLWRQLDASANSLNMLASSHYTHDDLLGKTASEKHDLLHAAGKNWALEDTEFKRGRVVRRASGGGWTVDLDIPVFNREPGYLRALIPGFPGAP